MRKLKVCHIITRLELGGAQRNTLYTAEHLDKAKFDVSLICGRGGMLDREAENLTGVETHFSDKLVRPISQAKDAACIFELASLLKKIRPDIVHSHSSKAGIIGRMAAKIAGVPHIIHTFHGFGFNDRQGFIKRTAFIAAEKFCARFSERLVFVSNANLNEALKKNIGDKNRYILIRSGIRLDSFPARADRAAKLAEFGIAPDRKVIISVANFKPQKNPVDFVRVAAAVVKKHPEAVFIYTGDGELMRPCRQIADELGAGKNIVFPGWRMDTAELMACADIFLLTSLWEGLPRSLAEALKSGLPAVAYDADGVSDILKDGENGFLIPRGSWELAAEKVCSIIEDSGTRKRLAENAAKTDLQDFDIDRMVQLQERLYIDLAQAQGFSK